MIAQIREAFPQIENCLITFNDIHKYIFEDNNLKQGVFVNGTDIHHLYVENRTNSDIHFIQNDDCVMINVRKGQCDYVIFNSRDFHFIDVKVASSLAGLSNHRKKAYSQIENTYKHYAELIDFPMNCLLHGLVCFPSKRRIVKPSESTKRKEFKTKYNIDLQISNYILFE